MECESLGEERSLCAPQSLNLEGFAGTRDPTLAFSYLHKVNACRKVLIINKYMNNLLYKQIFACCHRKQVGNAEFNL